jgi:hypothetical protein
MLQNEDANTNYKVQIILLTMLLFFILTSLIVSIYLLICVRIYFLFTYSLINKTLLVPLSPHSISLLAFTSLALRGNNCPELSVHHILCSFTTSVHMP